MNAIPGILSNAELARLKNEYPEVTDRCPTCNDKKAYVWAGQERECLCSEQKRLQLRYLHAGIGSHYHRLSWSDLDISPRVLDVVTDYLDNAWEYIVRGMGLMFYGPVGTGKTLLMTLVLKELVKADYDCYDATFAAAVENFTATWGNKHDEQKAVFARRFMRSRVLGLDDLGKEGKTSNRLPQTTFDYILRTRVDNNRPSILTTNMTGNELVHGYGAAVLSLLVEQSIEVEMLGGDFRPKSHDRTLGEARGRQMRPIT